MSKRKINDQSKDLNKQLDEILPKDYDNFEEQRERVKRKQIMVKKAMDPEMLKDPLALKRRAYELIIQGNSSYSYTPILVREFNVSESVVAYYLRDLKYEIREQYEQVYSILRESIIMDLLKMKNDAKTIHEKLKCYELIIKITGLSQENININQTTENKTFVITQIEPKNKEE